MLRTLKSSNGNVPQKNNKIKILKETIKNCDKMV